MKINVKSGAAIAGRWLRDRALPIFLLGCALVAGIALTLAVIYALGTVAGELAGYLSNPIHKASAALWLCYACCSDFCRIL